MLVANISTIGMIVRKRSGLNTLRVGFGYAQNVDAEATWAYGYTGNCVVTESSQCWCERCASFLLRSS